MIKINLTRKKKPSYVSSTKTDTVVSSGPSVLSSFLEGGRTAIGPIISAIGFPLLIVVGANYAFDHFTEQQETDMKSQLQVINQEKDRINKELSKIRGFDSKKYELDKNAQIVRTKIETIESLIQGRDFTAKALITLSQALPKDVWVTEITQNDKTYAIKGGTTDIGLISDFMSKLGKSIYYKDITLKSTSSDQAGFQANFDLTARRD